jgi:SagB-type dehydrogenase family enzyme
MKRILLATAVCLLVPGGFFHGLAFSQDLAAITLPAPHLDGGAPLMKALQNRHSTRKFSSSPLDPGQLSDLLWAASGTNRPDSGKRTAPSAMNRQEIAIYVALEKGLYLYEPKTHSMQPLLSEDIRALTGTQSYVGGAAVNLIYVADYSRMEPANRDFYAGADTGVIAENVYLFCAAANLGTVVRASIDRDRLAKVMKLGPDQKITLAQSVGQPLE